MPCVKYLHISAFGVWVQAGTSCVTWAIDGVGMTCASLVGPGELLHSSVPL